MTIENTNLTLVFKKMRSIRVLIIYIFRAEIATNIDNARDLFHCKYIVIKYNMLFENIIALEYEPYDDYMTKQIIQFYQHIIPGQYEKTIIKTIIYGP